MGDDVDTGDVLVFRQDLGDLRDAVAVFLQQNHFAVGADSIHELIQIWHVRVNENQVLC